MKPINSLDLPEPTKDELLAGIAELERQAAQKKAEQWQRLLGGADELRSLLKERADHE